ncbi:MAG: permease [Acidobacteria bacterium]|nr:permease [Acidobacteriota bacterium]
MNWKHEWKWAAALLGGFLAVFHLPVGSARFDGAVLEAFHLVKWYAREHVLLCLVPALFIAGAIAVFVSQGAVMKYLGASANKVLAYAVASVSGTVLAVCSCTVLPLFAGIYKRGAGLGPAAAFLYAGPAINVLAIILTARILGLEMGIARAVGAVVFSVVIGLLMHTIFLKEERERAGAHLSLPSDAVERTLPQTTLYFGSMLAILVFANWGAPQTDGGFWHTVHDVKWWLTAAAGLAFAAMLVAWFRLDWRGVGLAVLATVAVARVMPDQPLITFTVAALGLSVVTAADKGEGREWFSATWEFARQILPLLLFGVLVAGLLLGRPDHEGLIPSEWVSRAVGGNSLGANLFASVAGAFMYFATLTEVPILQGLMGAGMGKGPALALLLSGPALSLPSMLVLKSVMGLKKTLVFIALVVVMATTSGLVYGTWF